MQLSDASIAALVAVARSAQQGKLTVLAGAGLSAAPPANAPTWNQLRDLIVHGCGDLLLPDMYDGAADVHAALASICQSTLSPEIIFEAIDRFGGMSTVLAFAGLVDAGVPNRCHELLANLVAAGFVRVIMTSNWDTYVERAVSMHVPVRVYPQRCDIERELPLSMPSTDAVHVVHLHGHVGSLAFIQGGLHRIGFCLAPFIDRTVRTLLETSDCIVLGYRGADPEIAEAMHDALSNSPCHLYWLCRAPGEVHPLLDDLIQKHPDRVHIFYGDLAETLDALCRTLSVLPGSDAPVASPASPDTVQAAAARLGHNGAYLTLAFACGALGQWRRAAWLCQHATDGAYSTALNYDAPRHLVAANAYRFGAGCLAFDRAYPESHQWLRHAEQEYRLAGTSVLQSGFVLDLQRFWLSMAENQPSLAEGLLGKALARLRLLESPIFTVESNTPSLIKAALVAATAAYAAIHSDDAQERYSAVSAAYVSQRSVGNLWGHGASLLALAHHYYRSNRTPDARMALAAVPQRRAQVI